MIWRAVAITLAAGALALPAVACATPDPVEAALRSAALQPAQQRDFSAVYGHAVEAARHLPGVRGRELRASLAIVRGIAARGALHRDRMPAVFLTLRRNVEWWSAHGPPPPGAGLEPAARGRRCGPLKARAHAANLTFAGSGVVFEYYPGAGLQLQVNATFGSVNAALRRATPYSLATAGQTLEEMLSLASLRAGRLTWEYEFPFAGARPPWASGLSQATAIEAFTRAATSLSRPSYLQVALRLARLLGSPPPGGVQVKRHGGDWFLLYSFDRHELVLNADLDALVAIHDLEAATGSPFVAGLETNGKRALDAAIGGFDTGTWSRYSEHGPLADLNYHALNLELAQALCTRTADPLVCGAGQSFARELDARCPRIPNAAASSRRPLVSS